MPAASGSAAAGSAVAGSATPTPIRTGPLPTGPGVLPGEKPPVEPADAYRDTYSGAFAIGTYFVSALSWSYATTDPYLLQQISSPECGACARFIQRLSTLRRDGGHIEGSRFSLLAIRHVTGHFPIAADYVFEIKLTQAPGRVISPSGSPQVISTVPISDTSRVYVSWSGTSWHVVEEAGS